MASLCWNCDFVILFISILCICIVSISLSAANGVINDDDNIAPECTKISHFKAPSQTFILAGGTAI